MSLLSLPLFKDQDAERDKIKIKIKKLDRQTVSIFSFCKHQHRSLNLSTPVGSSRQMYAFTDTMAVQVFEGCKNKHQYVSLKNHHDTVATGHKNSTIK